MKRNYTKSRRDFLRDTALIAAGMTSVGRADVVQSDPDKKLNLAFVGPGGRGFDNLTALASENIVAFADVDDERARPAFEAYPKASRYRDFRVMLDKEKSLDGVVVSTPDHTHAVAAIAAMQRGLHVYCEKPLAHSIYEVRRMKEEARKAGVVTQMGTQGHALEGTRRAVDVIRSGAIGEVEELHVWTDRPAGWWPQGEERPTSKHDVPDTLDWDLWLGPASHRDYDPVYVPFKWRGRWDFGTGPIGDMGVHNLDTAFWALQLGLPTSAEVIDAGPKTSDCPPLWSVIQMKYPARGKRPPVKLTFYDGKKLPPKELFQGEEITGNGSLSIGSKGTLYTRTWHGGDKSENEMFMLLPTKKFVNYEAPKAVLPRTEEHHIEWIKACKGGPRAQSGFDYAATLTEGLLVGFLALRTGKRIEWDAENMKAIGCPEAEPFIRPLFRKGWEI
ncbi:MAG: putative dehydrogenase [Verrucomicrobiales bacterium]|jgi:predicted dehydrogenase